MAFGLNTNSLALGFRFDFFNVLQKTRKKTLLFYSETALLTESIIYFQKSVTHSDNLSSSFFSDFSSVLIGGVEVGAFGVAGDALCGDGEGCVIDDTDSALDGVVGEGDAKA